MRLRFYAELLLAVDAAVTAAGRQGKDVVAALLDGGHAAGIGAFDHVDQALRLLGTNLVDDVAILDHRDGDLRVQIAQNVEVQLADIALDLDDVLFAALLAADILQQGHACVVQFFQFHHVVQAQAGTGGDVVNDHAVQNLINR